MKYVHVEVPLAFGGPPAGRHYQSGFVRKIDLKAAGRRRWRKPPATSKINSCRAERLQYPIHAELETAGIGHTAEIWLVGNTVFSYARCHGGIETHAGGE